MGFTKKTWKNRIAEYINRRRLTMEDGSTNLVTVARDEGTISQEGDAFNAANMNDLEDRIEAGFDEVNQSLSNLTKLGEFKILAESNSESENNLVELSDSLSNYSLIFLTFESPTDNTLNAISAYPVGYFKLKSRCITIWITTSSGSFAHYVDDTHVRLYIRGSSSAFKAVLIGVK